jgi:hypothetical protein
LIPIPTTPNQADCCPPAVGIECFWLCDECAPLFTLVVEPGAGVFCVPKLPIVANEPKTAKPTWIPMSDNVPAEPIKVA